MINLVWYRSDLRTMDCEPLLKAVESGQTVHACFLVCLEQWKQHDWGSNRAEYLRRNLVDLSRRLEELRIPLHIRDAGTFADTPRVLGELVGDLGIQAVHWGCEYEVNEQARDVQVRKMLGEMGVRVTEHHDQVLLDPDGPRTGAGHGYKVFTPYRKAALQSLQEIRGGDSVRCTPPVQKIMPARPDAVPEYFDGFRDFVDLDCWPIGEEAALSQLDRFLADGVDGYDRNRDLPGVQGTSRLGPSLAVGTLSPWTCFQAANEGRIPGVGSGGRDTWISELIWREFYRHVMVHHPHVGRGQNFDARKNGVEWQEDEAGFQAWCAGMTGIPIVDAAMRCLVATGWMHNRLRMVVSQFLSKNLLIDWRKGEAFFARHLVDLDFASNNGGWQWSSSTGTDSAPYFRVFNPVRQGQKHDPAGHFVVRWIPELECIPEPDRHDPWRKHPLLLSGTGYPEPIVCLSSSRKRAIDRFRDAIRSADG